MSQLTDNAVPREFNMSREFALLASATAPSGSSLAVAPHLNDIAAPIDWPAFMRLAERHRIEPLAFSRLIATNSSAIPADTRDHMHARRDACAVATLNAATQTVSAVRALETAGIACAVLKGAPMAEHLYGELALRSSIDIDLLIEPQDASPAHQALLGLGYQLLSPPTGDVETWFARRALFLKDATYRHRARNLSRDSSQDSSQELPLELHWRFAANPCLLAVCGFSQKQWRQQDFAGASVRVPANGLLLVYLMVHGALAGWFRLKWLADIAHLARIMSPGDHACAASLCRTHGLEAVWRQTCDLLAMIYGNTDYLAPIAQASNRPSTRQVRHAMTAIKQDNPYAHRSLTGLARVGQHFSGLAYRLSLARPLAYKSYEAFTGLFSPQDVERLMLPLPAAPLYPLVSPLTYLARRLQAQPRSR